ncbi:MAG: hypothetical protein ACR2FY_12570 [Pirellulaceae bacterium]
MPLSAWLPLQTAASAFREECSSLEQLVQELFADLERLGGELWAKADELETGRRHLAERGRQLAEQRKEAAHLSHQLEQQETQLNEALAELRELRAELANRPEPASASHASVLSADSVHDFSAQFAEQFAYFKQHLDASQPNPSTAAELGALKQELLQQQEAQLTKALAELRELRSDFVNRPETSPGDDSQCANLRQQLTDLQVERGVLLERLAAATNQPLSGEASALSPQAIESLTGQMDQQFRVLHEKLQVLRQDPPEATQLESLKHERQELESELELVRARSAELQETVSRQKRELAAQRLEVSEELKELRTLIADQGALFAQHEPASAFESADYQELAAEQRSSSPARVHEEPSAKPQDPVVNSVMAQFARLQRDIAQRRKKK